MSNHTVLYLVHHVFLTPKLPQNDDFTAENENALLQCILDALPKFLKCVPNEKTEPVNTAAELMRTMVRVHQPIGKTIAVNKGELLEVLRELSGGEGGMIPLHIRAQNAGVLITKVNDSVRLEAFELSSANKAVMTTMGRLRRTFPGVGVTIDLGNFDHPGFKEPLARTLSEMSSQPAPETQPRVKKAGQLHEESRDTTHPKMVTELLYAFLLTVGKPLEGERIWKNVREEVNWDRALLPWHRSPTWLLIRVCLQLVLGRLATSTRPDNSIYKSFLVFSMAEILQKGLDHGLHSDLLLAMVAKLSRRLLKLGHGPAPAAVDHVRQTMCRANKFLLERWNRIQRQHSPGLGDELRNLEALDFEKDSIMELPKLNEFLASLARRGETTAGCDFIPSWTLTSYESSVLPSEVKIADKEHLTLHLVAFESWVDKHLQIWLEDQFSRGVTGICAQLRCLVESYHGVATLFYKDNPESTSLMLLTILELWIACDKAALRIHSLLKDYDPEIPLGFLESLLLSTKAQLKRLRRAELYLNERRRDCKPKSLAPNIYIEYGSLECFSARYFDHSAQHHSLKDEIESKAMRDREAKKRELRNLKDEYENLMQRHRSSSCDFYRNFNSISGVYVTEHDRSCTRCSFLSQANGLQIEIYEWPLPKRLVEAKSTVFELSVPEAFGHWREVSVYLLFEVLNVRLETQARPRSRYALKDYQGLSQYFRTSMSQQHVGLLSEDKPHTATHRKMLSVATATESEVCLDNGMNYAYYDSGREFFLNSFENTDDIPWKCTYKLPIASNAIQQFLFRPSYMRSGPSPNTVMATLHQCPDDMSIEEYKALALIPLGYNIQWRNILVQLFSPSVDFKKRESGLVVHQCIYQAGPPSDSASRSAHEICEDDTFASRMLEGLFEATQRFEQNWQSSTALATFTALARRLLTLTVSSSIQQECLRFLYKARQTTFSWAQCLKSKAQESSNDTEKLELQCKALAVYLICADTFNVDEALEEAVFSQDASISVFLQCSIAIQEITQPTLRSLNALVQHLHSRWQRTLYLRYRFLRRRIVSDSSPALDDAISATWSVYEPSRKWEKVSDTHDSWLTSKTVSLRPMMVHFCLLTGEFLVDGVPLDHLPQEYLTHTLYHCLFGRLSLEITPAPIAGMQFSSKRRHAGHKVHLGLDHGSGEFEPDLLLQASRGEDNFELVPRRCLKDRLPRQFVDDHVHWWDYTKRCVEFCHSNTPWKHMVSHWRLIQGSPGNNWTLVRDDNSLLDLCSQSAKLISTIFRPLEDPCWIHIVHRKSDSSLSIELPRSLLEFNYNPRDSLILSRQYRGMSVDADQSIGTLVGLRDKLVLKDGRPCHPAISACRKVLVLEGRVSYAKTEDHVEVHIAKDDSLRVHAYEVDEKLSRLVSNGSRQSNLFLCYLHALTSFAIPDPLTKRTGTEQALSILDSAAVRSFDVLTPENVKLLDRLARLTPGRTYYPSHERVMQTVSWSPDLSFLAQHGMFHQHVVSIFEQAERYKFFHPHLYVNPPNLDRVDSHLLERDSIRSSTFRVSGFGAESYSLDHDALYTARDRGKSLQSSRAFAIAHLVFTERPVLVEALPMRMDHHLWTFLNNENLVLGSHCILPIWEITYNAEFLLESSRFITNNWIGLQRDSCDPVNKYRLMMWLATLAFAQNPDMAVLQTLASFWTSSDIAAVSAPAGDHFDLRNGVSFSATKVRQCLEQGYSPFQNCPEAGLRQEKGESEYSFIQRRERVFRNNQNGAVTSLLNVLETQWPCSIPKLPPRHPDQSLWHRYIRVSNVLPEIEALFRTWYDNLQYETYLQEITRFLPTQVIPIKLAKSLLTTPEPAPSQRLLFVSEDAVFEDAIPPLIAIRKLQERECRLKDLLSSIRGKTLGNYQQRYVEDLASSLDALQRQRLTEDHYRIPNDEIRSRLVDCLQVRKGHAEKIHKHIMSALFGSQSVDCDEVSGRIFNFYQQPRLSTSSLLQRLNHVYRDRTPVVWRECLTELGLALSQLQRAERMLAALDDPAALANERRNPGHTNWSAKEYPDTLLLEVESGIMVREVQERIAEKMRSPPGGKNVVMQLNMGEGKSSVIVPMVSCALADGSQLVRVITAKPQSKQMFQMMVSKLGGLLNRRIFHMPFSRAVKIGLPEAEAIRAICQECKDSKGIFLVQPEHILSFQLMGIETAISGKTDVSRSLLKTKDMLDSFSRGIVDESDENFSAKFELVYTMGTQRPVEHSPDRWVCIHHVLDVLRQFLPEVQRTDPSSMEISARYPGCFPRTRILRESAKNTLFGLVARHLSEAGSRGLPMASQPPSIQRAVFTYISKTDLSQSESDAIETSEFWSASTKVTLLLLRGLIACQVLSFVFCQKRWRVDYGPDPNRRPSTRLAVPYRAKDNPSARSEFSHPDVVITLTSLSYYYAGLDDSDLFLSFEHLVRSDQADMEYRIWVEDGDRLPDAFHQLSGINLEDRLQCVEKVFPCIRFAKGAIDYFLDHIVFPKEMKEFPHKLSASGWDLGAEKRNATTGFSGTNDSRDFLPLSVKQLDLEDHRHTNALVLEYLLQDENSVALMPAVKSSTKSDAETLLDMVVQLDPPARVILDVGAQILELDNIGVAERWLQMMDDHEATQAVIFCGEDDHISVMDRRGRVESFQTSPFAGQTDVCLVFLDEAHTRGTDLKLPENYRAAVTVGANLTKDRLAQACMRMRKLGKGQSVVFCVPDEIQQKIASRNDTNDTSITVKHILDWSISETFTDLQRGIWLWANQGRRYQRHAALWGEARVDGTTNLSDEKAEKFLEEEAQTIETRYRPSYQVGTSQMDLDGEHEVDAITKRLLQFGDLNSESATFREEQERELSPEVEQEREVQKPPPATPAEHTIHPDVRTFVSRGIIPTASPAFLFAFQALADTSAARHYDVAKFPPGLLVTADFARTIIPLGGGYVSDLFQRPVQWILTSASGTAATEAAVIISPYEAQELLPHIQRSKSVCLHLYAPRPNVGYRPLDTLNLYTTPPQPLERFLPVLFKTELNLFSGQLYMKSMKEYLSVRRFLGLKHADQEDHFPAVKGADVPNLLQFIRVLMMKIRRNCESIDKTHLGRVLDHRALELSDFGDSIDMDL